MVSGPYFYLLLVYHPSATEGCQAAMQAEGGGKPGGKTKYRVQRLKKAEEHLGGWIMGVSLKRHTRNSERSHQDGGSGGGCSIQYCNFRRVCADAVKALGHIRTPFRDGRWRLSPWGRLPGSLLKGRQQRYGAGGPTKPNQPIGLPVASHRGIFSQFLLCEPTVSVLNEPERPSESAVVRSGSLRFLKGGFPSDS
jgi:hypothetical protein